jgi:hypothetical protein
MMNPRLEQVTRENVHAACELEMIAELRAGLAGLTAAAGQARR